MPGRNHKAAGSFDLTSVSPVSPDSLKILDALRDSWAGQGFTIEWTMPEVAILDRIRILVAPSGPYWIPKPNTGSKVPGYQTRAVAEVMTTIETDNYVFGGEELAQAVFLQCRYDRMND